ncbi:hypothetical protein H2198_007730 [Neophaeococcomyces mojaviensis]|uniref:Uncharacterized protein n=1 Tax=Neophaeococcomyces mojaviensis TaxID=3383035 RepID=A0ACC2ZZQ0_9EURO|nr:hypothetical protein H2198_007730 [Knufia sp. JES_112]
MSEHPRPRDTFTFHPRSRGSYERTYGTLPVRSPSQPSAHREITTSQDCHHHHSHEIIRSPVLTSAVPRCEPDIYHPPPPQFLSNQDSRLVNLLKELLEQYLEDTSTPECNCLEYHQYPHHRANPICRTDENNFHTFLKDLIDHLQPQTRYADQHYHTHVPLPYHVPPSSATALAQIRRCRVPADQSTDRSTLFEILFRITRRRRELARTRLIPVSRTAQYNGLIERLLQEIDANATCRCELCREELEGKMRHLREAAQDIGGGSCTCSPTVYYCCTPAMPRIDCNGAGTDRPKRRNPRIE